MIKDDVKAYKHRTGILESKIEAFFEFNVETQVNYYYYYVFYCLILLDANILVSLPCLIKFSFFNSSAAICFSTRILTLILQNPYNKLISTGNFFQ